MTFKQFFPELPFPNSSLSIAFKEANERYFALYPTWSHNATKKKLAAHFWRKVIYRHFLPLIVFAISLNLFFNPSMIATSAPVVSLTACAVFGCLCLTMYLPAFHFEFLPHLDACVENFRADQIDGIQQSKKQQYSVLSLMIIQQTLFDLAGVESGAFDSKTLDLLARQYGVSVKSIGPAIQLLSRADWNRKSIRKRTEILDDFETARNYFESIHAPKAFTYLEKLQQRVMK